MRYRTIKVLCSTLLLCLTAFTAAAQWSVGVNGGWDRTTITHSNA